MKKKKEKKRKTTVKHFYASFNWLHMITSQLVLNWRKVMLNTQTNTSSFIIHHLWVAHIQNSCDENETQNKIAKQWKLKIVIQYFTCSLRIKWQICTVRTLHRVRCVWNLFRLFFFFTFNFSWGKQISFTMILNESKRNIYSQLKWLIFSLASLKISNLLIFFFISTGSWVINLKKANGEWWITKVKKSKRNQNLLFKYFRYQTNCERPSFDDDRFYAPSKQLEN